MELLILILGKKYLEILLIKLFHMITFRIIMLLFSMYKGSFDAMSLFGSVCWVFLFTFGAICKGLVTIFGIGIRESLTLFVVSSIEDSIFLLGKRS